MKPACTLFCISILWVGGCATSDDPREGALIGYWQHGEKGYQERLDRRQEEIEALEAGGKEATAETERLREELDARRVEVDQQRALLDDLESELEALNRDVKELPASSAADVQRSVAAAQRELEDLDQDTELMLKDRRSRIIALQKELRLLRERASLLTTL